MHQALMAHGQTADRQPGFATLSDRQLALFPGSGAFPRLAIWWPLQPTHLPTQDESTGCLSWPPTALP
jgi:hypothetical protein